MTGLQKIFFGIGILAIIGLGVLVYQQLSTPVAVAPATNTMSQGTRSDAMKQGAETAVVAPVPSTPDAIVDDITKEVDTDNSLLSDEELGETSEIEEDGSIVSDFGTVYDENQN